MSDRIFAWLLRLYPSSFRREYTEEARHLYQARLRDESGFLRRSRLCYDLLADLIVGLPQAYRNSYAPAAASLAPDIHANPSFRLLEKEPLRPKSILGGGVLALTAVVAVTFAMTCPSSFQPLSPPGTPMSPVEAVMQRLNEATSPDSVGNADREAAAFDLGVGAGPQAQPSTQHSAQGPNPGHSQDPFSSGDPQLEGASSAMIRLFRSHDVLATPPGTSAMRDWEKAAGGKQQFDVASIRLAPPVSPSSPGSFSLSRSRAAAATRRGFPLSSDDSYTAYPNDSLIAGVPLVVYIQFAYKLNLSTDQRKAMLAGAPKWVSSDNYEIRAKASGPVSKDQLRLMMQALLADRFQLAVHFETREVPVFALKLAKPGKLGPNLHPHAEGPPCDQPNDKAFPPECYLDYRIPTHDGLSMEGSRNNSMEVISHILTATGRLDRPLVDQTGLSGNYDFSIEWSPAASAVSTSDVGGAPDTRGPTFLEALKEQLGMKIVSARAPVEFLIVDHIERPTPN